MPKFERTNGFTGGCPGGYMYGVEFRVKIGKGSPLWECCDYDFFDFG